MALELADLILSQLHIRHTYKAKKQLSCFFNLWKVPQLCAISSDRKISLLLFT